MIEGVCSESFICILIPAIRSTSDDHGVGRHGVGLLTIPVLSLKKYILLRRFPFRYTLMFTGLSSKL